MSTIENPIDAMIKNSEGKKVKMNNVHVESGNESVVGKDSNKNFKIIYNSMEHG